MRCFPHISVAACRPLYRLIGLGVAAVLTSCAGLLMPEPLQASGTIIYPAAPGVAVFSAQQNGSWQDIVRTGVDSAGNYTVTLPPAPPLPKQGNAASLVSALRAVPADFSVQTCSGTPLVSDRGVRVVVLSGGRYLIAGQPSGQLMPVAGVIGGQAYTLTVRTYAYATGNLDVTGDLACTYAQTGGATLNGTVHLNYHLRFGWNVLEARTEQLAPGEPLTSAHTTLDTPTVDWRYSPLPTDSLTQ